MKRKQVWRYYCEFCEKSNCSAASISKHERGCTANPGRICAMHAHCESPQLPIADLIAALKTHGTSQEQLNLGIADLRQAASNCPACILAAIRQSDVQTGADEEGLGIRVPFEFKEELKEFWSNVNDAEYASEHHDY